MYECTIVGVYVHIRLYIYKCVSVCLCGRVRECVHLCTCLLGARVRACGCTGLRVFVCVCWSLYTFQFYVEPRDQGVPPYFRKNMNVKRIKSLKCRTAVSIEALGHPSQ